MPYEVSADFEHFVNSGTHTLSDSENVVKDGEIEQLYRGKVIMIMF